MWLIKASSVCVFAWQRKVIIVFDKIHWPIFTNIHGDTSTGQFHVKYSDTNFLNGFGYFNFFSKIFTKKS